MKTKRVVFAIIWSIVSVFGFIIFVNDLSPIGYFMGFHLTKDILSVITVVGLYSDHPENMFLFLIILVVFIIVWIISIISIRKNRLFEILIICDNVFSLLLWVVLSIINGNNYIYLTFLFIENVIIICLILVQKKYKRTKETRTNTGGKTGDDSLS